MQRALGGLICKVFGNRERSPWSSLGRRCQKLPPIQRDGKSLAAWRTRDLSFFPVLRRYTTPARSRGSKYLRNNTPKVGGCLCSPGVGVTQLRPQTNNPICLGTCSAGVRPE